MEEYIGMKKFNSQNTNKVTVFLLPKMCKTRSTCD